MQSADYPKYRNEFDALRGDDLRGRLFLQVFYKNEGGDHALSFYWVDQGYHDNVDRVSYLCRTGHRVADGQVNWSHGIEDPLINVYDSLSKMRKSLIDDYGNLFCDGEIDHLEFVTPPFD